MALAKYFLSQKFCDIPVDLTKQHRIALDPSLSFRMTRLLTAVTPATVPGAAFYKAIIVYYIRIRKTLEAL